MVADDLSVGSESGADPDPDPDPDVDPPAESPTYVVNVDVAVSRDPRVSSQEPGAGTAATEYLFIVRGENEAHAPGALGLPGGKVDVPPAAAGVVESTARRETREEVGVDVADPELVRSSTFESDDGERVLNLLVAADYAGGEARPAAPDEVTAVEWRTAESVLADDETPPWTQAQLEALRRRDT